MRLVLDTNVIVAAFRSPRGASAGLVEALAAQRFAGLVSLPLWLEYRAVLSRPAHLAAEKASEADRERLLTLLGDNLEEVAIRFRLRPQTRDPDDEFVLETAVNGGARAIVTMETATFEEPARRFGVGVVTPGRAYHMQRA